MFSGIMLITAAYISAIFLSDFFGIFSVLFLAAVSFLAGMLFLKRKKSASKTLIALSLTVSVAAVSYGLCTGSRLMRDFSDKNIDAVGVIYSLPAVSDNTYKNRYILKLESVSYLGEEYKTSESVLLNTKETFEFGDAVTLTGHLLALMPVSNQYEYDYSMYYKSQGICGRIVASDIKKIGETRSFSPSFIFGRLRQMSANSINKSFSAEQAAILRAVLLDDSSGFSKDTLDRLVRTGVHRSLYSPFMHVSLIMLLVGLLSLKKRNNDYIVMLLLILYALANSTSPTALKVAAVAFIVLFGRNILGFAQKADAISAIVLIMLLTDPLLCFNGGFVMSVASSLLVYLSYNPLYNFISRTLCKRHHCAKACSIITLWIVFLFGVLPMSAYCFGGVPVYASLFTSLLSPLLLCLSLLSPLLMFLGAAPALGRLSDLLLQLPEIIEKLPFSYLMLRSPTLLDIIIFYLLWWIFLRAVSGKLKTERTGLLAVICLAFFLSSFTAYSFDTLSVYFVNVGQGDGAALKTSRGEVVLIDGGGSADYQTSHSIGERVYLPYLISHGLTDIDIAILSHPHKDHAEGIIAAAERLSIKTLVMPECQSNQYKQELEELSKTRGFEIKYFAAGDEIEFKSGLKLRCLAPDKEQLASDDLNDASLVFEITYGEFCALFTGDTTDIADESYPASIDLLKVAHHGSDTGSTDTDINRLKPEYAVISVGEGNTYGHPDDSVIRRLEDSGAKILRTDKLGDIRFKAKKNNKITYEFGSYKTYRK